MASHDWSLLYKDTSAYVAVLKPNAVLSLATDIFAPYWYSKTCLKRNLKGPEHFPAKARFPFNQGTLHTV